MKYNRDKKRKIDEYLAMNNCAHCSSRENLTIDHIVPVSFLIQQFGATLDETFDFDNFQSLCRRCNTLKAGRFDLSDVRTRILLIKYANKYCK